MVGGFVTSFFSEGAAYLFYVIGVLFWGTAVAVLTGGL